MVTDVTAKSAAIDSALLAGMLRSAAAVWRDHPSEVYRDAELAERAAEFIEAALAARPEPEGMETKAEERAAYAKAAISDFVWPESGFVGRLLRDFDRQAAEVASLKARLATAEAAKAEAVKALEKAEQLYQTGLLFADNDFIDEVQRLRRSVLAKNGIAIPRARGGNADD